MFQSRTHTCGQLRLSDAGKTVTIAGWMENVREVGQNFAFVIVRDFYGTTQVVIEDEEMMSVVKPLNKESTIQVTGTVRERASKNPKMPTGEVEIVPSEIKVLGRCRHNELPFEINRSREADESARLKYRYLDLRNPAVRDNIVLRCNVVSALRAAMTEHGFLEITTPILTASSPEGGPGLPGALPEAPGQVLRPAPGPPAVQAAADDRRLRPLFPDRPLLPGRGRPGRPLPRRVLPAGHGDGLRHPGRRVRGAGGRAAPPSSPSTASMTSPPPPPSAASPYREAMEVYGTDKPDLRIDLTLQDVTGICAETEFGPFQAECVKAVVVSGCKLARKAIDKLCAEVEVQAGEKAYWCKVDDSGNLTGGVSKFLQDKKEELTAALGLKAGDFVGFTAGKRSAAQKTAGVLRSKLGQACEGHMDAERYEFCWIVDFPMYEIGEESGQLEFCHNPFSMPSGGLEVLLKAERGEIDPLEITADQYDLVCNGVELSSGAVRNHDPEIMVKAFELVRLGEEDVKAKFPAMYNAFTYGAPPHAGIAPGVDRMVMLLSGEDSIREVIPFPMNKNAQDVMMGSPSTVEQKQLDEVHIAIVGDVEE